MKRMLIAILTAIIMILTLTACGAGEETTITGMVVSVEGAVISLVEMDMNNLGNRENSNGERPEMPEGGNFNPGDFNPEDFNGTLPEGETFPQRGEGEMPELPEGMTPPDGMTIPANGEMPTFGGEEGEKRPGFGNFASDAETKNVDIGNAHISVEIDGGKATGSMEDIKAGTVVTITMNGKGEATNVLVSSMSFGGGNRKPAN